ncbi:ATP-binding protein [Rossellomorea marisflavi]|uniref:ATP-binding protein n=1 Tax=Rossellomorea marisflavi TaxID=189381 RepID=UPI0015C46D8F|nr:AAA family ATPase [Rossellomorea marisflavi]
MSESSSAPRARKEGDCMKIKGIHIYAYGKLINQHYTMEELQVIFGQNEAGKSTIMSFIHSVLFGFPTKQHSLPRYEPKTSSDYGGVLRVCTPSVEEIRIERKRGGPATGTVTLQYEDGRVEGEEGLHRLLGTIDRKTYGNIFSFDLEGLQGIHRLKKEDLNRFLFSAGSTGTDVLMQMEQAWQKEQEQLFKRSGRKPVINLLLSELTSLEKKLKEAKGRNDRYAPLHVEKEQIGKRLEFLEHELKILQERKHTLLQIRENWDALSERVYTLDRIGQIGDFPFPEKGLHRLDECRREVRKVEAQLETLQLKKDTFLERVEQDAEIEEEERSFLEEKLASQGNFQKWIHDLEDHRREVEAIESGIRGIRRELQLSLEGHEAASVNISFSMNERINDAIEEKTEILHEREHNRKKRAEAQATRDRTELECDAAENRLMGEEAFQDLQRKIKKGMSEAQRNWLRERLEEEERMLASDRKTLGGQKKITLSLLLIGLILTIWGIWMGTWIMALALLPGVMSILSFRQSRSRLIERENRIQSMERPEGEVSSDSQRLYDEQLEYRSQWKQLILKLEETEGMLAGIVEEESRLVNRLQDVDDRIAAIVSELGLPVDFQWKWLREAYIRLKELVTLHDRLLILQDEIRGAETKIQAYTGECREWFNRHGIEAVPLEEIHSKMKELLKEMDKEDLKRNHAKEELNQIRMDMQSLEIERTKLEDEVEGLFSFAGTTSEEAYRKTGQLAEEKRELLHAYRFMEKRFQPDILSAFTEFQSKDLVEKEIILASTEIDECSRSISTLQEEAATLAYELQVLEEGTEHSILLQQFEGKKAEIHEKIQRWSAVTLARKALENTMEHYQQTKMPRLIGEAEQYFLKLTNGRYRKINVTDDEMITVAREDGQVFQAVELSQGTKEQLYIAIRFALISSLKEIYDLPVIIDDAAVNFDEGRTRAFIEALDKLSENHQILYFTCHQAVVDTFQAPGVINLDEQTIETGLDESSRVPL